jgi:radical SAM protein with 4Fe4S-binding SPASM domain
MRIEIAERAQKIELFDDRLDDIGAPRRGGKFFNETVHLKRGSYAARVQVSFSERAAGELISICARVNSTQSDIDRFELTADPSHHRLADNIYLRFSLPTDESVEILGYVDANCDTTLLRYITIVEIGDNPINPEDFNFASQPEQSISSLRTIIIGTTGICNASCIHCPTNKPHKKSLPHGYMNMTLFSKIVAELSEAKFVGDFMVGLFGEPLADPFLGDRLRLIKKMLPQATVTIPTNCGMFDPEKHSFILELADIIAVHVEAISAEVYNRFMDPLKIDHVLLKILSLLELDRQYGKVHITTPVNKGNLGHIVELNEYFRGRAVRRPAFTRIGNRSWDGGPWNELSLAPMAGHCTPDHLQNQLIIDWDGVVLPCCPDFSKSNPRGDLKTASIAEVLQTRARLEMMEVFRTKQWSQREACRRCRWDSDDAVQRNVQDLVLDSESPIQHLPPRAFFSVVPTRRGADGHIEVGQEVNDGVVIYGPYQAIPAGRYRIEHTVEVLRTHRSDAKLIIDINVGYEQCLKAKTFEGLEPGPKTLYLNFELDHSFLMSLTHNAAWSSFEFRIAKFGVDFVHKGATLYPVRGWKALWQRRPSARRPFVSSVPRALARREISVEAPLILRRTRSGLFE